MPGNPATINNRTRILQTARILFHRAGYHATSVDTVVARSRVAKSNFYYHFRSKEELILAVLDIQLDEFDRMARRSLLNSASTPAKRLEAFLDRVAQVQVAHRNMAGCPFGNLAAALSADSEDAASERIRTRLCDVFSSMEGVMQRCLGEGIAAGEFRADLTEQELSRVLIASIEGLLLVAKTRRSPAELEDGFRAVRLFIRRG